MTIQNYGKKLIKEGILICEPKLVHEHDFQKLWAPDFMESIVFFKSRKDKYTSSLHFFWQSIFHLREVKNQIEAEEIFTSTHLYKSKYEDVKDKIKALCPNWFSEHEDLIPNGQWINIVWDDETDVFILFEDDEYYYGWGWDNVYE